jgi:hypothetical protein
VCDEFGERKGEKGRGRKEGGEGEGEGGGGLAKDIMNLDAVNYPLITATAARIYFALLD